MKKLLCRNFFVSLCEGVIDFRSVGGKAWAIVLELIELVLLHLVKSVDDLPGVVRERNVQGCQQALASFLIGGRSAPPCCLLLYRGLIEQLRPPTSSTTIAVSLLSAVACSVAFTLVRVLRCSRRVS